MANATNPLAILTHPGAVTRTLDAAVATTYLLAKTGSTALHAALCGATDRPIGVYQDTGGAGELVALNLFGSAHATLLMVPAVAVSAGDALYTAAGGKVTNVPATGCYLVGHALTDGAQNGRVEVDTCTPRRVGYQTIAAGIHTWAGGADTTDSIAVAGLLATDVILVTTSVGPAVVTAIKGSTAVIDVVLGGNGTDGTTKLSYAVLRAEA